MAIPDYQTLMLPVLKLAPDNRKHKFSQEVEKLADEFKLTADERSELLPSGSQVLFTNRVGWARSYLKQAGLLDSPKRGFFIITHEGNNLLAENPEKIDIALLEQYPEFIEFKNRKKEKNESDIKIESSFDLESNLTPEDALASAYNKLRSTLESRNSGSGKRCFTFVF
ncbi:restriction system protein [Nitrosomonas aestuarii]|uniref:Restriction system protein n=1 Tax=Nitrosomonas aestuarii TaxID=52441 RepID=A0A1I4GJU8_9PROT|nr:winged helix-turn-helix domain-containing protein [Nitrosomonas aestuarii]SFL29800.1 restriction system protein [Nitrosomonas aestuarii]